MTQNFSIWEELLKVRRIVVKLVVLRHTSLEQRVLASHFRNKRKFLDERSK